MARVLHYKDWLGYDPARPCAKCGSKNITTRYHTGGPFHGLTGLSSFRCEGVIASADINEVICMWTSPLHEARANTGPSMEDVYLLMTALIAIVNTYSGDAETAVTIGSNHPPMDRNRGSLGERFFRRGLFVSVLCYTCIARSSLCWRYGFL